MARSAVETIVVSAAGERAGLAQARHARTCCATPVAVHLLRNGAPTRYIQELLGHRHLSSTQVYTHVLPQDLKRAHRRSHPAERATPKKGEPPAVNPVSSPRMKSESLVPAERIERAILLIRGQKVMLDTDLAKLYGVYHGQPQPGGQAATRPLPRGLCLPADAKEAADF